MSTQRPSPPTPPTITNPTFHAAYIAAWEESRRLARVAMIGAARRVAACAARHMPADASAAADAPPVVCMSCRDTLIAAADAVCDASFAAYTAGIADQLSVTPSFNLWLLCRFALTYRLETYKAVSVHGLGLPASEVERLQRLLDDVVRVTRRFRRARLPLDVDAVHGGIAACAFDLAMAATSEEVRQ